jgi:hypothetical protein
MVTSILISASLPILLDSLLTTEDEKVHLVKKMIKIFQFDQHNE